MSVLARFAAACAILCALGDDRGAACFGIVGIIFSLIRIASVIEGKK